MRISHSVYLVGGIPVTVAAAIAVAALLLLNEAEQARSGAVMAGAIYRNLISAMSARDDYIESFPFDRSRHADRFTTFGEAARADLAELTDTVSEPLHLSAAKTASEALGRYIERMGRLREVTERNDALIADMAARAKTVISLTDQARARQQTSNADIVMSLTDGDGRLRATRDVVDRAQELKGAIAAVDLQRARSGGTGASEQWAFGATLLRNAAADLADALRAARQDAAAAELASLAGAYQAELAGMGRPTPVGDGAQQARMAPPAIGLSEWTDRLLKVNTTEGRTIHDELTQLLTYSVEAHETLQATQNIAISTLKLGERTARALANRDPVATAAVILESRALGDGIASLPISPLIQTEMLDAIDQWRDGLETTNNGLLDQSRLLGEMNASARTMIGSARSLNDMLSANADTIGRVVREILFLGAAVGLLLGSVTGFVVARSITGPLKRLQHGMMQLAADTQSNPLPEANRRDELGDMARAANFFVTEIGRREKALRRAKDRADNALGELKKTQAELIQAEKLASLGQLVAGVAHEINTPLGVALTTATLVGDEVKRFGEQASTGQLQRSVLQKFVARMGEGSQLLFANLTRAADLVHSFKQVAADQASGERRRFDMQDWLNGLLTSLGPMMRKTGHKVSLECPPGIVVDTYPGALAQILTNLLTNAVAHAYDPGQTGHIAIAVSERQPGWLRLVFSDDGRGVPPENRAKVFDPFFTTGRGAGSTGLGLHIVYNLVTQVLHGRIELASEVGRGTRFTIDLPVTVPAAPPGEPPAEPEPEARVAELEGASR